MPRKTRDFPAATFQPMRKKRFRLHTPGWHLHASILAIALLTSACAQPDAEKSSSANSEAATPSTASSAISSAATVGGEETIVLSAFLTEEDLANEASPEGRLVIGRGEDYVPSSEPPAELFARLKGSMKERRQMAWKIVEDMVRPIELDLPEGKVHVPLWHTWYESGVSGGNPEIPRMMELFFEKRKARPDEDSKVLIDEVFEEFASKDLARELIDENMEQVLRQLEGFPELTADALGRGFTLFSPSFVAHLMEEAKGIEGCPKNIPADQPPPSPDNFSPCFREFPRSAVMVKTNWQPLDAQGVTYRETDPVALKDLVHHGSWRSPKRAEPEDNSIYKVVTAEGTEYGLAGIHFSTKDTREWVWVSLWWHPQASLDYGEDRPASLASFNNGVWDNYKMCVTTAFREGDPEPGSHYAGTNSSLAEALTTTHEALEAQLIDGGSVDQFPGWPPKPHSTGPWPAPHDQITTWCSNPNLEFHPGNGRTNCIGCHQFPNTHNDLRNQDNQFWETMAGDYPQYGRDLVRANFPADFAWSFYYEFTDDGPNGSKGIVREAREAADFEWPPISP